MSRNQKDETYDDALIVKDAGLVAADDPSTVDGSDKIIDLGAGRFDGRVKVTISAIEVASNDERYFIQTQFSSSATFASGIVNGPCLQVGALEITDESADTPTGEYELPFCNEYNGTVYRYMRTRTQVEGTIAGGGGINWKGHIVKAA